MKIPQKKLQRFNREMKKGRAFYPQESKYEWLKDLLDAYQIADAGTRIELESLIKRTNRKIVCDKGCFACCLNPTIPINQIELMGLSWYVSEIMDDETYERIAQQLITHSETTACHFLLDGACSVYPVRPLACRVFHVFDNPCENYEDVSKTRPEDIAHGHKVEIAWMVTQKLMPHMGVQNKADQLELFGEGFMMKNTRAMHTFDWKDFKKQVDYIKKTIDK
ncbi:YkgJ family cysteine cluster protein [Paenibacillus dendritiformis]|uniref:YkgJ family cysteine cluster protein n=1 Tax=Paenibacillus dendritiformis TaxID=130049 RepID=UPI00387E0872